MSMNQVDSSGSDLDFDIDLESGGTTSEEDATKSLVLGFENPKNLLGGVRSGLISSESVCEFTNGEDCSCSYGKSIISDEISAENKEQLESGRKVITFGHKTIDDEKPKKQKSTKPSKPPRPPKGPSLDASDMKLLKEITELKLKRRKMEKSRTFKKIKKEKASSLSANLFACLVTLVFLLVIIFQGSCVTVFNQWVRLQTIKDEVHEDKFCVRGNVVCSLKTIF